MKLFHCLQPLVLYTDVNASKPLHAALRFVFLHASKGFGSTQVFDSKRYCILQKEREISLNGNQSLHIQRYLC